ASSRSDPGTAQRRTPWPQAATLAGGKRLLLASCPVSFGPRSSSSQKIAHSEKKGRKYKSHEARSPERIEGRVAWPAVTRLRSNSQRPCANNRRVPLLL